jgi:hypothetical protein
VMASWESLGMFVPIAIVAFNALIELAKQNPSVWGFLKDRMRTVKWVVGTGLGYLAMSQMGGFTQEMFIAVQGSFVAGSWVGRKATVALTKTGDSN